MAFAFDCGNDGLFSTKCGEFLDYLWTCKLFRTKSAAISELVGWLVD